MDLKYIVWNYQANR